MPQDLTPLVCLITKLPGLNACKQAYLAINIELAHEDAALRPLAFASVVGYRHLLDETMVGMFYCLDMVGKGPLKKARLGMIRGHQSYKGQSSKDTVLVMTLRYI